MTQRTSKQEAKIQTDTKGIDENGDEKRMRTRQD